MHTPDKQKRLSIELKRRIGLLELSLKGTEPKDLDKLVNKLHHTLFKKTDCKECQNCCKSIVLTLTNKDISRISKVQMLTSIAFFVYILFYHIGHFVFWSSLTITDDMLKAREILRLKHEVGLSLSSKNGSDNSCCILRRKGILI